MVLGCYVPAFAEVTYCTSSAFGYGNGATGGGTATPVLVSSVSQLQSALNKAKNKVIIITQNLTFTTHMTVQDGSNVTLMGLPGVTLTSLQQDKSNSGILYVKRFNKLIIRNLTFVGPGAYDCDGWDLLCFENVTNAWVDHCDFQDGCDGNFDNKGGTDNVTVSWCRFRYLKAPKAGGSGGSDDHRYTNLLGSSSSDKPGDGAYNFTWAYCWWDNGCKERMVRCRNAELHFLNCYWNSSVANYYVGPENAKCYFEGCTFEGKANTASKIFKSYGGTNACKFVDCAGNLPSNSGTVSKPSYTYTASGRAEAKTAVTNATCGAGATLTVTTAGAVSSTCDSGAPLPTVYTVTWDANTNDGFCGTATSSVTSGAAIGSLPEATKDGYTFDGWFTKASGGTKISSSTTVTGNVTYYAHFTSAPVTVYYTVIWDANGGTCAMPSSEIEAGTAVGTLPTADKAGDYSFDGWYTAVSGGTKITTSTVINANVTYYAHYTATGGGGGSGDCYVWAGDPSSLTDGSLTANTNLLLTAGASASIDNAAVWSGSGNKVIFKIDGSAKYVEGHLIDNSDITSVTISAATNQSSAKIYAIVFSPNSAFTSGLTIDTHSAPSASAAKDESNLVHEFTAPSGTKYFRVYRKFTYDATDYGDNQTIRVYGVKACSGSSSAPTPTFALYYDENGGSGTMAETEQTGANVTVAANSFTAPTGYAFKEWNGNMSGGGTVYTAGQELTLTEDLTIYAIWQAQAYTVTLDAGDGTGGSTSVSATFDEAMPSIAVPTRSGYVFSGYFTGTNGTGTQYYDGNGSSTNSWDIAADTELHAYWVEGSSAPTAGCDLHFWFFKAADAEANGKTNSAIFSGMVAGASDKSGSITIDGTSYSVTRRTGDNATFGQFTIPSGYTGVFYALAISSGGSDRQINLVCGSNTYELPVAGGSDSYKRIESEELPAGTYTIARDGSSNVRLGIVVVKLCEDVPAVDYTITHTAASNGTYTIQVGSGSAVSTNTAAHYNQVITLEATPEAGYELSSWTVTKESGGTVEVVNNQFTMPEDNVTITATFVTRTYTIDLNNQSATGSGAASVEVAYNSNITLLAPISCPHKTGYFFDGSYTEPDGGGTQLIDRSGNFLANVAGYTDADRNWIHDDDVTLYAKWTALTVTLTISPDQIDPGTATNVTYTITTNAPTGTIVPYIFAIYNFGTSEHAGGELDGAHDINDGLSTTISMNMSEGMWYTRAVIKWAGSELATSEKMALQVGSVGTVYTVTYDANGGSVTPSSRTQASEGASITLDTPTRTDYTFLGWYVGATKIGEGGDTYIPTANVTAVAAWKQDCAGGGGLITLADINFKDASWSGKTFSQGNTTTSDEINGIYFYSKNSDAAKQFSLADNTKNGLTFPNNNMSSGNYYFCIPLESGEIDGSITVTLKHGYSSNKASYKYVFADGRDAYVGGNTNGSGGTQVSDANSSDTEITFDVAASNGNHKGHLIIGRYGGSFTHLYGVTVTTGGSGGTCYYVTYDGNGADGGYTNDPTAYSNNAEVTVAANGFTKTGYVFQGWAATTAHRDAGTVDYNPAETFNIAENTTLYAVWAMPCTTPAAPTTFVTTEVTGTSATFLITDDASAASYDLYYASGSPAAPTAGTAATETVTTKTPTISGLTAATTYTVWVRSVCDADHKSEWVALTGSTFITSKSLPASYTVGASAEGECEGGMTVRITLSGSQMGVDYQLKKDGENDGAALAGTGSALEWTGRGSGVYTVWAVENATYFGLQMNKTVTIEAYAATAITTQPVTTVAAEIDESFTLGTGMADEGHELTYRWYTCGSTGTDTVFISGATSATYTTSQSIADTYYYRVRVEGTCGEPVLSDIITVTISSLLTPSDAPTISVQPVGDTYCDGDAIAALSVIATGSGTVTYQWKKDGVDIPSATAAAYTPSISGTYSCVVTNTEGGKIATSLTSGDAVLVIHEAVSSPVISQTDNTVNFSTATDGATIYYTTDGTDPTTGSASGTSYTLTTDCTVKAYAVKDGCASGVTSFDATFDSSVKECAVLISYTLSGSGTATPAIPADGNNLVGGTADYKVSDTSTGGGYKLNSDQYFGLSLASGQFKAGDKVTVTITKKSDTGDKGLHMCTSKTGTAVASIAAGDVVVGDNVFTLTADCDAVYVARNSNVAQNPYVKAISVCRDLSQYTVTFDKNNALATGMMSPQYFYEGYAAKLTTNSFQLTDYIFAGWATDPSGSKVYDDKQSVTMTGDITLYAIWEPAKYTLTNTVSPAGYGTVDVASIDEIMPGTATTNSANTYTVKSITVTATPAATTAEYTYAFDSWSGLPATVTEDATVTANFTRTARTYSVTLHTNEGTINSGDVTDYTFGTGATLPTDVTKAGAEFVGWYENSGLTGSAVTEIATTETGDKEYWAKWITCPVANSGAVVYRFEVKSSVSDGNICSVKNEPVNIVSPTQLSTLIGGTLQGMVTSTSYNNLTFKGGRITYDNGGAGVLIIALDCPLQEGDIIRFNNYSSSNSKYNYLRHTSYNTSDDQLALNASQKATEIQSIAVPAAFAGKTKLYIVSGARTTGISYFEIIRSCPVLLDANTNGGKVDGEDTKTLRGAIGDATALPHAFKDGYRFKGWFDAPSGGVVVSDSYTITGATTLYAQFEDCPDEGTLYKFEVRTGLTNGSVTANDVDFEFTTANYLTALTSGTLTTGGSKASKVTITGNNALSVTDNAAYLKIDLDCEIHEGDVFKTTINGNTLYINNSTSRTTNNKLEIGTLIQTPVPEALIGKKTLYLWKGDGDKNAISYFEIVRPKQAVITLDATGAYNKYTRSVVAIYERAMPEIHVRPQRTGYIFAGYYDEPNGAGTQYYDGRGNSMRDWDKDVKTATLYAYWVAPCDMVPVLEKIAPEVTIWDNQEVDLALVRLTCNYDTTGIRYSLSSASEAIPGCTFSYFDERIYVQGTPALGNTATVTKTITFTMTNNCSPARTYTVDATIRIYPAGQKAKIAYIITGTEGGAFTAFSTVDESASADLLAYLRTFYMVDCVNGYATKDPAAIANFYKDYDLLIVTDFLETPKGYTNAIGTLIDKKPILSFEAYVAGENGSNWHIGSNPKDPSPKVQDMKVLCAGHAVFKDAEGVDVINDADTTVHVLSSLSSSGKGLQGFVINEAPDFIFLATIRDADNNRDLVVSCERQVVFPARLLLYGINYYEMGNLSPAGKVVMHQMVEYLLMTDETKVADCSLVFDNNHGTHLWSDPLNWAPGYNITPTPFHGARIIAECHVDVDYAHAGNVKINKGHDENGNPVEGKLIIKPYGGLTIAAVVQQVNDTRYASPITIKAEDLLIESDETGNGSFVYGNKESDVRATVEYYSLAEGANTSSPVWQYMGTPFQAGQTAIGMYREAWMCRWAEGSSDNLGGLWQWVDNEDMILPFEGYCITQAEKKTYTFAGKLNAPVTTTLLLDNCDEEGYAFAANSWTAPIKIQEMQDEDFTNAEKTIYIYHSGSFADWTENGTPVSAKDGAVATLPGQYAVVPIHASPYILGADSVIPAMQGFFVKTTDADATLDLVYNRVVYDAKYFKTSTQPMRAPRRVAAEGSGPEVMRLVVAGEYSGGDQVHILARTDFSEQFEDGWDGRKIDGDEAAPKLAVVKESGGMAVAAVAELEGRELAFRAGEDSIYTFHFDYEGETIYLYDRFTGQATLIRTGNTYSFEAGNRTAVNRFLITANPPLTPTDIGSVVSGGSDEKPVKYINQDRIYILYRGRIYDMNGCVTPQTGKEETR